LHTGNPIFYFFIVLNFLLIGLYLKHGFGQERTKNFQFFHFDMTSLITFLLIFIVILIFLIKTFNKKRHYKNGLKNIQKLNIVITGGGRGIGYGLSKYYLFNLLFIIRQKIYRTWT
jgi:hypothetical protein